MTDRPPPSTAAPPVVSALPAPPADPPMPTMPSAALLSPSPAYPPMPTMPSVALQSPPVVDQPLPPVLPTPAATTQVTPSHVDFSPETLHTYLTHLTLKQDKESSQKGRESGRLQFLRIPQRKRHWNWKRCTRQLGEI